VAPVESFAFFTSLGADTRTEHISGKKETLEIHGQESVQTYSPSFHVYAFENEYVKNGILMGKFLWLL